MMENTEFREALGTLGVSQLQFARETDMNPSTVLRWATGESRIPGIAEAYVRLRLKVHQLSAETEPPRRLLLRRAKVKAIRNAKGNQGR